MPRAKDEASLRIGVPTRTREADGTVVVAAEVNGQPIWFSSKDVDLAESAEAFASALLVPAAAKGGQLVIDAVLDQTWLENSNALQQQLTKWWEFPGVDIVTTPPSRREAYSHAVSDRCFAQCFTGGVDSYYELITASSTPGILIFVHGYDIPRSDKARLEAFLPGFYETAQAFDAKPVLITTNLREHPIVKKSSWEKGHGGALAAVGHLLADAITDLTIPSSYPYHDPKPWGSHWDLDPLWSTDRVRIRHGDATHRRNGKVRAIAANDLVRRHVRVCHENNALTGNCSHCEKCIRTMIAFANAGMLDSCEAFDRSVPLSRRVDRLPRIGAHLISVMEELRRGVTDPELAQAVDRLISRSQSPEPAYRRRLVAWRKRVLQKLV